MITSAVVGVVGQRLLRKVCSGCAEEVEPDPALLYSLGITAEEAAKGSFRVGRGCPKCVRTPCVCIEAKP